MINALLKSFSDSNVHTEVQPIEVATVMDVLPQDFSHVNLSEAELHSPAVNAARFWTQKGSVSVMEFGDKLVLFGTGQLKSLILDMDTPLERVRQLILGYVQ